MQPPIEKRRALIVVRTYPTPARTGVEVSCTAAITEKGEWLRLFPVPYRFLDDDQRFRKFQWVDVTVHKAKNDARPESYRLEPGPSIKIVSDPLPTKHAWEERKRYVFPLRSPSLCSLEAERDAKKFPTLGVFRPQQIKRLTITPEDPNWSPEQLDKLRQNLLFQKAPAKELEKLPVSFRYEFDCDASTCPGHSALCTDWEMGQSWRKWRDQYGDELEAKFRQRYEDEMINKNDTHFFVGTVHRFPKIWMIVGLFYPPKGAPADAESGKLFAF